MGAVVAEGGGGEAGTQGRRWAARAGRWGKRGWAGMGGEGGWLVASRRRVWGWGGRVGEREAGGATGGGEGTGLGELG